jgi:hypothetical protein
MINWLEKLFKEKELDRSSDEIAKEIVDKYSHALDALPYITTGITGYSGPEINIFVSQIHYQLPVKPTRRPYRRTHLFFGGR